MDILLTFYFRFQLKKTHFSSRKEKGTVITSACGEEKLLLPIRSKESPVENASEGDLMKGK